MPNTQHPKLYHTNTSLQELYLLVELLSKPLVSQELAGHVSVSVID